MRMAGSWQCGRARPPTAPAAATPSSCYGISSANPPHRRVGDDACHAPQRAPCPGCSGGELSGGTAPGGTVSRFSPTVTATRSAPPPFGSGPRGDGTSRTATVRPRSGGRAGAEVAPSTPTPPAGASRDSFRRGRSGGFGCGITGIGVPNRIRHFPHQSAPSGLTASQRGHLTPAPHADADRAAIRLLPPDRQIPTERPSFQPLPGLEVSTSPRCPQTT